ncbi:trans-sulfuration enzyme family protein [Arcticibacter eurypsychrophilus]|uniref:trans-sulfuration enzyme family protein n=1 Tax=Arcticibacter eurypsychrophilus TaxID=1434752 RepID=UPI00084D5A88|nr:aminotransferase class I/II-fold pyridoxal phosphate-dependent enzyme [Arcticibacter eurypsychrophilus]
MKYIETSLIHTGKEFNTTSSVTPPIYQTSTYYAPENPEEYLEMAGEISPSHFYHRHGNPVNNQAAAVIASLEGKEAALMTSSGMGAISTAVLSIIEKGDHIIAQNAHYSSVSMLFREFLPSLGVEVSFVDQADNEAFQEVIRPNTRLIYLETPSNPILTITDLSFVGKLAKEHGIVTMCDNTFASPINQRPGDFGIDVVVHSATKYLGGHSDLTAGVICADKEFIAKAWKRMIILGTSLSSFDSWLLLKGLRTLSLRMERINSNALQLASWMSEHKAIKQVLYCGLPSHPQYELARKQMKGFTGMICIDVAGDDEDAQFKHAQTILNKLVLFTNAASLGGVESLIVHPASMWGKHHTKEQKLKAGISNGLLRISVGIEHINDLIADFDQAL